MVERNGTEVLTAAQMRAVEAVAVASGKVSAGELMERAGESVVAAILANWPALEAGDRRAIVLCGPGNNGGDGFVVARLLRARGWTVAVYLYGAPERLPDPARAMYDRWCETGRVTPAQAVADVGELATFGADLFIDALFGIGLTRPIEMAKSGLALFLKFSARWRQGGGPRTVSVDLPSGLCSDSGAVLGGAMMAALTVTFHAAKLGHLLTHPAPGLAGGPLRCGQLVVADIGLPRADRQRLPPEARARLAADRRATVGCDPISPGLLAKPSWQLHKYAHGHALVLAGGAGRGGAGRLAARAALRIGAGLVTLGCPTPALAENAAQLNAVMLRAIDGADDLARTLDDRRIGALCLGPGLGVGAGSRDLTRAALGARAAGRATVLDADALTVFAETPETLFDATCGQRVVLTPHGGEFARLFPDISDRLQAPATAGPAYSRVDAARAAAARAGCVVLMKGPDTVIAAPDGRCSLHAALYERAAPWLATAGSGDVLAGLITGLLARGFEPMQAAETAAWLHVEAARRFGPGLIAEDLPEILPEVLRAQGL
ncbi:bifunctional NAD(P)H-hydrate repair enzyme [Allgaiera indica]|uniref:Bifunctional NAD(P)H-hydrate repair enzyme n=1 Tax=Allgaiera indica TaxID=765699 RepID=A0AAN4ZYQ9_9RHOB|nr:bifunctional ADP-dependent NAD(P)H-hydrate dehydratase/NAD(P)H-hydrate epimerase [Allgaiera indica]GHE00265.1 bifunctional NAD(P)H-hydrate repair enzyme [Allgaiera indica]SDW64640.1 yjeF C-terminal region, hydroxyethylthiazole kinase-related/yjeF N-terminal region [Allgaiera indica]